MPRSTIHIVAAGLLAAISAATTVVAQPVASTYFPYAVGDSAWFNSVAATPSTFRVTDSLTIAGKSYLVFDGLPIRGGIDTLRVTDDAVLRYAPGGEEVLFDFTVPHDSSYETTEGRFPGPMMVYVARDFTVSTNAGDFENAVSFYFDHPQAADEEYGYALAPGIGIASYYGAWQGGILDGVSLGGVTVTNTSRVRPPDSSFELFPNPAQSIVVVERDLVSTTDPIITVHDILGRRLPVAIADSGTRSSHLDVSGLAPGRYFVRLIDGRGAQIRMVTIVR